MWGIFGGSGETRKRHGMNFRGDNKLVNQCLFVLFLLPKQ